jgi:hypothetical protein
LKVDRAQANFLASNVGSLLDPKEAGNTDVVVFHGNNMGDHGNDMGDW